MESDAKEIVQHARSTHFVLLVTCATVVAAAFLAEQSDVQRAAAQLRELHAIFDVDRNWAETYRSTIETPPRQRKLLAFSMPLIERADFGGQSMQKFPAGDVVIESPVGRRYVSESWVSNLRKSDAFEPTPLGGCARVLRMKPIGRITLSQLREVWEATCDISTAERVDRVTGAVLVLGYANYPGPPVGIRYRDSTLLFLPPATFARFGIERVAVVSLDMNTVVGDATTTVAEQKCSQGINHVSDSDRDTVKFLTSDRFMEAGAVRSHLMLIGVYPRLRMGLATSNDSVGNPLKRILDSARSDIPLVRFDEAFANLSALAKPFADVPIDELENILTVLESRAAGQFEIFGVKLPLYAVRRAGVASIFAVQLYLLLQLMELRRKAAQEQIVVAAWFCLYPGRLIFGCAVVALAVLPVLALSAIAFKEWRLLNVAAQLAYASACAASTAVAIGSCLALSTVRTHTAVQRNH